MKQKPFMESGARQPSLIFKNYSNTHSHHSHNVHTVTVISLSCINLAISFCTFLLFSNTLQSLCYCYGAGFS